MPASLIVSKNFMISIQSNGHIFINCYRTFILGLTDLNYEIIAYDVTLCWCTVPTRISRVLDRDKAYICRPRDKLQYHDRLL